MHSPQRLVFLLLAIVPKMGQARQGSRLARIVETTRQKRVSNHC